MIDAKRDFGAVGDGQTDDTAAIQSALDAAGTTQAVFLPAGTYCISAPLSCSARKLTGVHHWRVSQGGTILKVAEGHTIGEIIQCENNACQIEDLILDAAGRAAYGLRAFKMQGSTARIRNVSAVAASTAGFYFEHSMVANFEALIARQNLGDGFLMVDCNASRFFNLEAIRNQGNGIVMRSSAHTAGAYLVNGDVEENKGHGILVQGLQTTAVIENYWLEQNQLDGIRIDASHLINIRNCRVSGHGTGENRAFRLSSGSSHCLLDGNSAARESGAANYAGIELETGCVQHTITNNSKLYPFHALQVNGDLGEQRWVV